MRIDFYKVLVRMANLLGPWFFAAVARCIATGYFLLPWRTKESRRFYARLFPQRSALYRLWCTFRQYQNFTTIHLDRYLSDQGRSTRFVSEGKECLDAVIGRSGAILLMSHLGNWEMAAHLLMRECRNLRLLLYMGVKEKEGVEKNQKEQLRKAGVTIIGVGREEESPFSVVDGIRLLQTGGIVSMTGDVVWRRDQRYLQVPFLGGTASIPEVPFVFALVSGAPIYVFFAFRTGKNSYRFELAEPLTVEAADRSERKRAIWEAARRYAALLEEAVRAHPLEWYHFDRFMHFQEEPLSQ